MKDLYFKQEKPITVKIMGSLFFVFGCIQYSDLPGSVLFLSLSLILFGYGVSFKITKDFINYKCFTFFGIILFKTKLDIVLPDYISLFAANFSKPNDWSTVSALGSRSNSERFVIRFFNKNETFTVFTSTNKIKTRNKAIVLSEMLDVELLDKIDE